MGTWTTARLLEVGKLLVGPLATRFLPVCPATPQTMLHHQSVVQRQLWSLKLKPLTSHTAAGKCAMMPLVDSRLQRLMQQSLIAPPLVEPSKSPPLLSAQVRPVPLVTRGSVARRNAPVAWFSLVPLQI